MKTVVENSFVEDLESEKGLDQHTSISNGADNGANNCMAGAFHRSMRHGSTRQAVDNFKSRLNSKPGALNIGGHGSAGSLETGSGQSGWDWEKQINTWNTYMWKPILEELKGKDFPIMTIYSCSTGAGEDGADLLWEMAKALGRPVRARTGLAYCGGNRMSYQPGSTWQTAHPNVRPTPIPETPHKIINMKAPNIYLIDSNLNIHTANVGIINTVSIATYGVIKFNLSINTEDARKLAAIIFNNTIQVLPGSVLGYITMELDFVIDAEGKSKSIKVEIYNDSVALIKDSDIMYNLPNGFRQIIGI